MDSTKTLPASWYCSKNLYELEQRAIFQKAWYLLGPTPRFAKDEEVEYELAGVTIRACKQQDGSFLVLRKSDVSPIKVALSPQLLQSPTPHSRTVPPTLLPPHPNRPSLRHHLPCCTSFPHLLPQPRVSAQRLRLHASPPPPQHRLPRRLQLEDHG